METAACKIVIGLPSTLEELADYVADPRGRDLLASQQLTVQQYERQVLTPLARMLPIWRSYGARIYPRATLGALASAVRDGHTSSLFLISHWRESPTPAIEFLDGMAEIDDVASALPVAFDGVVDLCICQSIELAKRIKSRCPEATVKWVNVDATPAVWFHIHTLALRLMHDLRLDYLDALNQSLRSFEHAT